MRPADQILAKYTAEIEERQTLIDTIVEGAAKENRDLSSQDMELIGTTKNRITELRSQLDPIAEARQIAHESRSKLADYAKLWQEPSENKPREVEYRSAGEYALDMWQAGLGNEQARNRMETYNRAAAHQTTADNTGLLPAPILGPVLNFIDEARPVVSALGPRQLPGTGFSRPKITQHTAVAAQSAEKAELTSQKMVITKLTPTVVTLGGYVNISRQNLDWSQPGVLDIVIQDLAAQYAILTESTAVQAFYTGGTAGTVTIPASPTADNVAAAFWGAVGQVYTGVKGAGRLIAAASPDVLGILGPLFAPVNPVDSQSQGLTAASYGQGAMGAIGGVPIYVTAGFGTTKRLMVMSTAAAEVYEDRIGSLQVVEPSVLGLQVAYAGYFTQLITEATGIIKVTVT